MMRVLIVANVGKPQVQPALDDLLPWLSERADVVGVETADGQALDKDADVVLVLGGDGTLLSAARRLNGRPVPLMGVNYGRLGFLAGFTPQDIRANLQLLLERRLPVSRRAVIEASVIEAASECDLCDPADVARCRRFVSTALNDAVVTAGPPFHMIELQLAVAGEPGVRYYGDGVIVSTPSGSTAYNVSAGGPILSPGVEAMCITPICPHSLSFRPVVVPFASTVQIVAARVNEGTTLFCDGQASTRLAAADRIIIRRSPSDVLLVENPSIGQWRSLAQKLHWAVSPMYEGGR